MLTSRVFASLALALASVGSAAAGPVEDANRTLVTAFYDLAFVQHQPTKAARDYIGDVYIQHNPRVPNGAAAFHGFFERFFAQNPTASSSVKRVLADGDLVAIHSHAKLNAQDQGRAIVDLFRVENGRIVEHWDVIQDVPATSANGNTMFEGTQSQ